MDSPTLVLTNDIRATCSHSVTAGMGMTFSFLAARMLLERFQGLTSPDHDLFASGRNHHA